MAKNNLRKWRENRGMTQQALAVEASISVDYVRLLEQQPDRRAGADIALRLAKALDVDADQLFFRPDFGQDRLAVLGELYADDMIELSPEDREKVIRYALCDDEIGWKIIRRGHTPWSVVRDNSFAFDVYMRKFKPAK